MCSNIAGERNRRRRDCDCVFDCLEELLEGRNEDRDSRRNCCCRDKDVRGERNRRNCDCVFDCLGELLEDRDEERNRRNRCCCCFR